MFIRLPTTYQQQLQLLQQQLDNHHLHTTIWTIGCNNNNSRNNNWTTTTSTAAATAAAIAVTAIAAAIATGWPLHHYQQDNGHPISYKDE